jgi:plasmid stabilization system protein ParE
VTPVVFRRAARQDYAAAVAWYESKRAGLGAEFAIEIRRRLVAAPKVLKSGVIVEGNVRRMKIRRFPFHIFYRIRGGQLVVIAIFHARRNPIIWRARIQQEQ